MFLLFPTQVGADNHDHITVVAVPNIAGGILTFNATLVNDTLVQLDWTVRTGTVAVVIRAKYSTMPASRTDGYLVYGGDLFAATDNSMNLDVTLGTLYYRIWAQNNSGVWLDTDVNTQGKEGLSVAVLSTMIFFGVLAVVAIAMTIASYFIKKPPPALIAAVLWMIVGAYSFSQSKALWDINYAFALFGIFAGLAMGLQAFAFRDKDESDDEVRETFEDKLRQARETRKDNTTERKAESEKRRETRTLRKEEQAARRYGL
jgi:hypothetical protein